MKAATVTLDMFLKELDFLSGLGCKEPIVEFSLFINTKHQDSPALWPLAFTQAQGGWFTWERIHALWAADEFKVDHVKDEIS